MSDILKTIESSLNELLASSVKVFPALLTAVIVLFLTRYMAQFAQRVVGKAGKTAFRSHSIQILLEKTAYVMTWVIGVVFAGVLVFPGLDLGDIIATLGLGSVAIGFAFQDIIKNFFAGILLLLQEPFSINDQIIIDSFEGTVEKINFRTTQIRTYQGERILIPNANVFTSAVQVQTAYPSRRTDLGVGVDYNTPLEDAASLLQDTIEQLEGVLPSPRVEIDLVGFGDSSIDFIVRYWTEPQQAQVRRIQTKAIIVIKKAFDKADINIPYPIRTLYYYNQDNYNDYMPTNRNSNNHQLSKV
ncbi:mechanosensitive ion channel family protein [Acaryochloris marina]|uniref:Mechanosensitive ion channel protein n=1 Tax=Acaryochloris marina (strain MBIC 11017) TaxID=329726 RepID=B0C749_ACAM1|nr:mechanosensitive ion channel family protein [Acaryochloris marina]ABW30026.1 Mechanosensitive ion channel protein [Acaryochloris marina MBIC11017]BDM78884.1 transporter [Acaryochloris marina MBIC10699]